MNIRVFVPACLITVLIVLTFNIRVSGQITLLSNLSFGNFTPAASSGTVTITNTGNGHRIASGVTLMGGTFSNARFSVGTTTGRRRITITVQHPTTVLTRAGGGGSMTLNLGTINPGSYWHNPPTTTRTVRIGGTLNVGTVTSNPPGNYTGSFTIIVNNF